MSMSMNMSMIFLRMTSFIENSRWRLDVVKACIPSGPVALLFFNSSFLSISRPDRLISDVRLKFSFLAVILSCK